MKYIAPEMGVFHIEAEEVIRTSIGLNNKPGDGGWNVDVEVDMGD